MRTSSLTGGGASKVLLLSENSDEQSHYLLGRLIKRAGFDADHFYYGVLAPDTVQDAIELGVKTVVPLGEQSLRALLGEVGIERWRGRVVNHPALPFLTVPTFKPSRLLHRKQPKVGPRDCEILLNPPRFQRHWLRDLHYAVHVAKHGFVRRTITYVEDPTPEVFLAYVSSYLQALELDETLKLSFDIETPYKQKETQEDELEESEAASELNTQILRISFSYAECHAISIPWLPQYYEGCRLLLESQGPKVVWNGLYFDIPVLEGNDFPVHGVIYDGMDAWHFLKPQLPKGLEAVSADCTDVLPWKHLTDAEPQWYSCADADVALRNVNWIFERLHKQGAWESYLNCAVTTMQHLKRAGRAGNKVDRTMQDAFKVTLDDERARLNVLIQAAVPQELKPRRRYKRQPFTELADAFNIPGSTQVTTPDGRVFLEVSEPNEVKVCSICREFPVTKGEHTSKKSLSKTLISETHHKRCGGDSLSLPGIGGTACSCPKGWPKRKWQTEPNRCHGATLLLETHPTTEWDEVLPFNANSSDQMLNYMKHHKHPVGTDARDADKETADDKHLRTLSLRYPKHPIYQFARDMHRVSKARSTYCPELDANDLVFSTFTNTPWTWRLGNRAINFQNWGKRWDPLTGVGNKWAKEARIQIIARTGHKLVNADSSSVEAVMQGFYMGDRNYMDKASKGIHTWAVTQHFGWEWNADSIAKAKSDQYATFYNGMKVSNFLTNFGGGPYMLWKLNPDLFPTLKSAERQQELLFDLIPTLEAYQYAQRFIAHKQTWLKSPWNVVFDFFDVFTYKRNMRTGEIEYTKSGRPKLKLGKDGKKVVAVLPQHSNGMFSRENINLIGASEYGQYLVSNCTVHDSYMVDLPDAKVDGYVEFIQATLSRPIVQMGNLRIGCEVEIGSNWGGFHETKNPGGMQSVAKTAITEQQLTWMPKPATEIDLQGAA